MRTGLIFSTRFLFESLLLTIQLRVRGATINSNPSVNCISPNLRKRYVQAPRGACQVPKCLLPPFVFALQFRPRVQRIRAQKGVINLLCSCFFKGRYVPNCYFKVGCIHYSIPASARILASSRSLQHITSILEQISCLQNVKTITLSIGGY